MKNKKFMVQVYEHLTIEITINENEDGYKFKTPKGLGGRHYYSFCNHLDDAFAEQYPTEEFIIRNNIRNN